MIAMMYAKPNGVFGAVVFACAALAACGGSQPAAETKKDLVSTKPVEYFHPDPATAASVHGKISFHGTKPPRKVIAMDADANCVKANEGKTVYQETVVTGKDGALLNAFIYVKTGLEGKNFEPPKEPVKMAQHGCMFTPRAIGVQAGQPLAVANADPVSHNFHAMPSNNRDWDQQQSPGAADMEHRFPRPEIMIPVKCNVHAWMRAYIGVMPHPYFDVTGADGAWSIPNLPPGDYTVAVWHETLGERTAPLHLGPGGKETLDFKF
jgi:plastocyanin